MRDACGRIELSEHILFAKEYSVLLSTLLSGYPFYLSFGLLRNNERIKPITEIAVAT